SESGRSTTGSACCIRCSRIAHGFSQKNTKVFNLKTLCRDRENNMNKSRDRHQDPPRILNVKLKAKDIDNARWVTKHLIMNLEILAALDKTDPRYEVYKEAALKDKHNIDLFLQIVL